MSKAYRGNILIFMIFYSLPLLCADQSSSWFNFSSTSLPHPSQINLATVSNYVTTGISSLAATTVNAVSDDAALIKLGWPIHNELAIKEAHRNKEIYKTIETKGYRSLEQIADLSRFLERRMTYLMRIYNIL